MKDLKTIRRKNRMGFLGKLIGATMDVVLTPVEIVKDIATMGGVLNDENQPYTLQRLNKATKKISDAADDASKGDLL
jgi:hypothetical protein